MDKSNTQTDNSARDKYVALYKELVGRLEQSGRPTGPYKDLTIKDYYDNRQIYKNVWLYNRHHIDEIRISGSRLKLMSDYKDRKAIIVDFTEHALLHYLIVMAQTTNPNTGFMLNFGGHNDPIGEWETYIKRGCQEFGIAFDARWRDRLTLIRFPTPDLRL